MAHRNEVLAGSLLVLATLSPAGASPATWSGGVTLVGQAASDDRLDDAATASGDLVGELGVGAGRLTLYLEAASTVRAGSVAGRVPESNGDAGSAQDRDGHGRVQASELKFTLPLGARQVLTAGVIDIPSYVDQSRIASDENTQFLAAHFVQNPTIAFPDYTPGVVLARPAQPGSPGFTLLLAGSHGLADNPGRTYAELFDLGASGRGVFADVAGGWVAGPLLTRVGAWMRSNDQPRLDGSGDEGSYGIYVVQGLDTAAGHFSLRAGWANPRVSVATAFLGLAWQRAWPGWVLGAGASGIAASADAPAPAADSLVLEAYLRRALGHGWFVTPSLQYFHNPAQDGSGALADADLGVANLRLTWLF